LIPVSPAHIFIGFWIDQHPIIINWYLFPNINSLGIISTKKKQKKQEKLCTCLLQ
jgi:hypothetical protein